MARRALACGLLLALPVLAAFSGARGPLSLHLNLGPGDGPYLAGFLFDYEIDDRIATHWTTYDATVSYPLEVRGPVTLTYRYARVFPQTAVVEVYVGNALVDRFECRGGRFEERTARALLDGALSVRFKVDSHDGRNMGLKLDWVRVDLERSGTVRLQGTARFRAFWVILICFVLLTWTGWEIRPALALAAPAALAACVGLLFNPWTTYQLLRGIPLALLLLGGTVLGLGRLRRSRDLPRVTALVLAAFLLRGLAVNHPRFYYPDLRTHARLVETIQKAGLDFLRSPAEYIEAHGVWRTEAYGRTYAFPYTPAFHLPFVFLPLAYDDLLVAMKLFAAAVSTVPIILVWALARRFSISVLGAVLMIAIPTYTSRLSFAFLPALWGHTVDLVFIYWLSGNLDSLRSPRVFLRGALLVAACQLAYVSGAINVGIFLAVLAVAGRQALPVLGILVLGSALSVVVYYRDFLPMVVDVLPRALGGASRAASRYPVQSWLAVTYERTRSFFDGVYPLLASSGLILLWRRRAARPLVVAWVGTYFLLLLGRAKMPDLFLHGHETMLVTPLVALASGEALARISQVRWGRFLAYALVLFLLAQGLSIQWRFVADQLANAL